VVTPPSSTAQRALRRAARLWGATARTWDHVEPSWLARILAGPEPDPTPAAAREALARAHATTARPDFGRVHPSWIERATRGESAAVLRTLLDHAPPPVAQALRAAFAPGAGEPAAPTQPPHPAIVACVLALWSERLVGGQPDPATDPLVVTVLTGSGRADLVRLLALIPLVKHAYLPAAVADPSWPPRDTDRFGAFQAAWRGENEPALVEIALRDLAEPAGAGDDAGGPILVGLVTLARLLEGIDPHRVRWVLQHLPYGIARYLRGRRMTAGAPSSGRAALAAWEGRVLRLARDRLRLEREQEAPP
jgi:hypothetical protein